MIRAPGPGSSVTTLALTGPADLPPSAPRITLRISSTGQERRLFPVRFFDIPAGLVGLAAIGVFGKDGFVALHGQIPFLQ